MAWLEKFVAESNKIEGIHRSPYQREIEAHEVILSLPRIDIPNLQMFVSSVAPGHSVRSQVGMDVMIGHSLPMLGGPDILVSLTHILEEINNGCTPYRGHVMYEILHPFTDGNGRSGRAIWLWMMQRIHQLHYVQQLGFLHNWYYQSLEANQ